VVSIGTIWTRALMAYIRVRGSSSAWLFAALDGQRLATNALKLSLKRAFERNVSLVNVERLARAL
jgi:hypothetical protein